MQLVSSRDACGVVLRSAREHKFLVWGSNMLGVPPHLADPTNGSMSRPIGLPPPFVNLNHPALHGFPPLAAMAPPGQIPLGGMHGLGHLNIATQPMIPGLPPIVVTAVVMPNGAAVHPIQQLQQQKRLRSHATPLSVEEALHAARLEGLTLQVAPSTKTGYKGTPGPEPPAPRSQQLPRPLPPVALLRPRG